LIGINRAGQTLVEYAPDLLHRVEIIRFGRTNVERIQELVLRGQRALNCSISIANEIAKEAEGSFAMAQVLCHEACLQGHLLETSTESLPLNITVSLPRIRESVLTELHPSFFPLTRDFATGNRLRREGCAPYLNLLRWLSQTQEGVLDTKEAVAANTALKGSIGQVIEKGYLLNLINSTKQISSLFHFDSETRLLTIEDPKLLYFIRHLIWSKFAAQVGYFSIDFKSRYDFALSFAGEDRELAEAIEEALSKREISVFYDRNEQHRILANDVEEYLAPIAFSRLVRYDSYLLLFPNILIMKPHSIAFRQKIIEVHEVEDISQRKLAKRFNVALSFIQKLLKQYRETDSLAPKVRTQQTPAKLNNEHLTVLRRLVEERNDATLEELRKQLIHETGIDVSRSTVDRALDKLGLTLKKRRSMLTRRKLSESSLSV
jgi:transposase